MPDPTTKPAPRKIDHPALAPLRKRFGEGTLSAREFRDMVTILVPRQRIVEVCTFLRDDPSLRYNLLCELNGVDYLDYPGGAPARFAVNYGLTSIANNSRLWLKVLLDPERSTKPGENEFRDEEAFDK